MKKGLIVVVLLMVAIVIKPVAIEATSIKCFKYSTFKEKVIIIKKNLCSGEITIPEKINGLPVTAIGNYAFNYEEREPYSDGSYNESWMSRPIVTAVTFPKTLRSIGAGAFQGQFLKNVKLPDGLIEIGNDAFADNEKLKTVTLKIPESVKKIGFGFGQFKRVVFPKRFAQKINKSSGDLYYEIFKYNGKSEVRITSYKFESNKTVIKVPAKIAGLPVTEIGPAAFYMNSLFNTKGVKQKLHTVQLPNSIRKIDDHAFMFVGENAKSKSLNLPTSLQSIGDDAFLRYKIKGQLKLPNNLKSIGMDAFSNNEISEVIISSKLKVISSHAFAYNQILKLDIPKNVTTISNGAFYNNKIRTLTIPKTVKQLGSFVFADNEIRTLHIETNLKIIPAYAFSSNLISVLSLPPKLETIDVYAFEDNHLKKLVLKSTVKTIKESAFANNRLTDVTVQANNLRIKKEAFMGNPLQSIKMNGINSTIEEQTPNKRIGLPYNDALYITEFSNWGKVIKDPFTLYFKPLS